MDESAIASALSEVISAIRIYPYPRKPSPNESGEFERRLKRLEDAVGTGNRSTGDARQAHDDGKKQGVIRNLIDYLERMKTQAGETYRGSFDGWIRTLRDML